MFPLHFFFYSNKRSITLFADMRTKQNTARKSTGKGFHHGSTGKGFHHGSKSLTSYLKHLQTARKSTTHHSLVHKSPVKRGYAKKSCTPHNPLPTPPRKCNVVDLIRPPGSRHSRGTKALKEIRHFQNTTSLLINRLPFQRLVRSICVEMGFDVRFQVATLEAIQVNSSRICFARLEHYYNIRCACFPDCMWMLLGSIIWRCEFVCHPCQTGHHNATGHFVGTTFETLFISIDENTTKNVTVVVWMKEERKGYIIVSHHCLKKIS